MAERWAVWPATS